MKHIFIILIGVLILLTSCSEEIKVEPQQREMAKRMEKRRNEILQSNNDVKQYYYDNYIIYKINDIWPGETMNDYAREYGISEIDIRLLNGFGPYKMNTPLEGILLPAPREVEGTETK